MYVVADPKELPQIFVKEAKNAGYAVVRREDDQRRREERRRSSRASTSTHLPRAQGTHRHGDEGHGARGARDRRRRSAAGVLADRPRPDGGVRVGREGSLGAPTGCGGAATGRSSRRRARARAAAAARRSRSTSRRGRSTARRDRWRLRSRRATPTASYRDLLRPVVQVDAPRAARAMDLPARQVAPGRYEAQVVADARKPLAR